MRRVVSKRKSIGKKSLTKFLIKKHTRNTFNLILFNTSLQFSISLIYLIGTVIVLGQETRHRRLLNCICIEIYLYLNLDEIFSPTANSLRSFPDASSEIFAAVKCEFGENDFQIFIFIFIFIWPFSLSVFVGIIAIWEIAEREENKFSALKAEFSGL